MTTTEAVWAASERGPGLSPARSPMSLPASQRPILLVVVDTEEEFDWQGGFDRTATTVEAMKELGRGQEICDEYGVRPAYLVDFPVAAQRQGFARVKEFVERGRAELGAHLHPWVSPPFEEELSARNSFAGNLPADLERRKIRRLVAQIEESFGMRPRVYKAGRYGFGPNTATILEDEGFEVDLSACPGFDFSDQGGPDYSLLTAEPYWFGSRRRLLGLPATGALVGLSRRAAPSLYRWANGARQSRLRLPGILARLGIVDRLHLSPEGFTFRELRRLTEFLVRRGGRVFTLSFHSPTLVPGHTPYVQSHADLARFLGRLRRYLEYFLVELEGITKSPLEVRQLLGETVVGKER